MSEEKKSIFSNLKLFQKIKGIKHLEMVAIVVLLAIALLVYFSFFPSKGSSEEVISTSAKTSLSEYTKELESKLSSVLSNVKNAGTVSVMITFDGSPTYIYATDENQKTNKVTNGATETSTSQTSSSPILVEINGEKQPLICQEILPPIKGVLIVSSGAEDVNVRLELQRAAQTVLNVPTASIEILVGNKK